MNKKIWILLVSALIAIVGVSYILTHQINQETSSNQISQSMKVNWEDVVNAAKKNDVLVIVFSKDAQESIEKDLVDAQQTYTDHDPAVIWVDRTNPNAQQIINNLDIATMTSDDGKAYSVAVAVKQNDDLKVKDRGVRDNGIGYIQNDEYKQLGAVGPSDESALKNYFFNPKSQNYKFK